MRWVPRVFPRYVQLESNALLGRGAAAAVLVALVLSWGPVREWTGMPPAGALGVVGFYLLVLGVVMLIRRHGLDQTLEYAVIPFVQIATISVLVGLTRNPTTFLWSALGLYAVITPQAYGLVASVALAFFVAPLGVAAAWHLHGDVELSQSLGASLGVGTLTAFAYAALAMREDANEVLRRRLAEYERAEAASTERERIARDLHDSVGSALTEVGLWLDVEGTSGPTPSKPVARARARVGEALDELRACVGALERRELALASLESLLQARLGGLCTAANASLSLDLTSAGTEVMPASQVQHVLLWVQEAVTNAVRHAGARRIEVRLRARPLMIEVCNDGAGFDPGEPGPQALASLRSRAAALQATLEITPRAEGGTVVRLVSLPRGLA